MQMNPVISLLGRRLRLAVIGGGTRSFIGQMHRQAARMDDRYELVTGVLSSTPEKSITAGKEIGFSKKRLYSDPIQMMEVEAARDDSVDVIAIMTPNDTHYAYSIKAMELGFDVICDKPMTNSLSEAEEINTYAEKSGRIFCLTHNYTGYPLVRQARAMREKGELGEIRLIQVEYVQGGKAKGNDPTPDKNWKYDPRRSGYSRVMGDIGTHAHNLIRFVTGLEVSEVAADSGTIVPDRIIDDYAGALLRMNNGARGSFWVTQAAAGVENSLRFRISGSKGTLEWLQEVPQKLVFKTIDGPEQTITPNGPVSYPITRHSSRIVAGHPEGFPSGFANIYSDAALQIAARRAGMKPDPMSLFIPNAFDGLQGIRFVKAVVESSNKNSVWVNIEND